MACSSVVMPRASSWGRSLRKSSAAIAASPRAVWRPCPLNAVAPEKRIQRMGRLGGMQDGREDQGAKHGLAHRDAGLPPPFA